MSDSFSKKATNFLQADSRELHSIFTKVKQLEELNQQLSTYLEPAIARYCCVANITEDKLVLIVANGSIATQLRFQSIDLILQFQRNPALKMIKRIECKVNPEYGRQHNRAHGKQEKNMSLLTPENAEMIKDMARSLEDPKLKAIMEKIAQRTK